MLSYNAERVYAIIRQRRIVQSESMQVLLSTVVDKQSSKMLKRVKDELDSYLRLQRGIYSYWEIPWNVLSGRCKKDPHGNGCLQTFPVVTG